MMNDFDVINFLYDDFIKRNKKLYFPSLHLELYNRNISVYLGDDQSGAAFLNTDPEVLVDFFKYLFPQKDFFFYLNYKNHNYHYLNELSNSQISTLDNSTCSYKITDVSIRKYFITIESRKLYQYLIDNDCERLILLNIV